MWIKLDMLLGKVREGDSVDTSALPTLFSWAVDPNGAVTPGKAGDEYINTATWHKRYAQDATNSGRVEINYLVNI